MQSAALIDRPLDPPRSHSLTSILTHRDILKHYSRVDFVGKNTLMDIRNRIRDKIEPRIYADIQEQTDDNGKKYIKITVSGLDIPYSFDGRYYLRNVSADEQASNDV